MSVAILWLTEKELVDLEFFLVNSSKGWKRIDDKYKSYKSTEEMDRLLTKIEAERKRLEEVRS